MASGASVWCRRAPQRRAAAETRRAKAWRWSRQPRLSNSKAPCGARGADSTGGDGVSGQPGCGGHGAPATGEQQGGAAPEAGCQGTAGWDTRAVLCGRCTSVSPRVSHANTAALRLMPGPPEGLPSGAAGVPAGRAAGRRHRGGRALSRGGRRRAGRHTRRADGRRRRRVACPGCCCCARVGTPTRNSAQPDPLLSRLPAPLCVLKQTTRTCCGSVHPPARCVSVPAA